MSDDRQRPAQPAGATYVGLLAQVMSHTLDEDYETVAEQRRRAGKARGTVGRLALPAVVAVFGLMIGVSALKTEQDRPQARLERSELVEEIHQREQRYAGLRAAENELATHVARLQSKLSDDLRDQTALSNRLELLGLQSGALGAEGPGVTVTVDDAPRSVGGGEGLILDTDLRLLVNGLWKAGAEAIAIDGHRLTALTSIRYAGRAITVDYRSLTPPYVIEAIGDPNTLPARLLETPGGQAWLSLERNFGIRFDTEPNASLTLPADPHVRLSHAEPEGPR